MLIETTNLPELEVTCNTCHACCCRLEVMLITNTGAPARHIKTNRWGGEVMNRLDDGWSSALNRDNLMCTIYENRPWICREFEMSSYECITERSEGM